MRCILDGWEFVWRKFSRPYFRKEDGTKIKLEVKDFVPYLPSQEGTVPAAVGIPFHWKSATGSGEPVTTNPTKIRVSVPGSEYHYEDGDSLYSPSVLDDGETLGQELTDDEDELQSFLPGELHPGPPAATTPDPHAVSDDEQGDEDGLPEAEERLVPSPPPEKRDKGEAALRAEATTLRHLMTHTPKNPFCSTCNKAKMHKPTKRSKGGSETVEVEKFGDHITCDHLVTRSLEEESIDGDRVVLVFTDVTTNFRWIYPSAAGSTEECYFDTSRDQMTK